MHWEMSHFCNQSPLKGFSSSLRIWFESFPTSVQYAITRIISPSINKMWFTNIINYGTTFFHVFLYSFECHSYVQVIRRLIVFVNIAHVYPNNGNVQILPFLFIFLECQNGLAYYCVIFNNTNVCRYRTLVCKLINIIRIWFETRVFIGSFHDAWWWINIKCRVNGIGTSVQWWWYVYIYRVVGCLYL